MLKKACFVIGALLLAGGIVGALTQAVHSESVGDCPPGYTRVVQIEPLQPGEKGAKTADLGCQPISEFTTAVLEPLSPEEFKESTPQPTGTSPIVRGPSDSPEYRCIMVLEPFEKGSGASEPICGSGLIESAGSVALDSLYLIAKFYDNTNYGSLLIEYYGQYPCSAGYSYGRPDLRVDGVDNRFASGQGFSSCDLITVYDLYNYREPKYSCGPSCPSFYALNDEVSSWKIQD